MGLSYTGSSCLLMASVAGCRRVPEPPARMMPFRVVIVGSEMLPTPLIGAGPGIGSPAAARHHPLHACLPGRKLQPERLFQFAVVQSRIMRAPRGGGVSTRRDGPQRGFDRPAQGLRGCDQVLSITVPRG